MSLFIPGDAFPETADFAAAKIAIFIARSLRSWWARINSLAEITSDVAVAADDR